MTKYYPSKHIRRRMNHKRAICSLNTHIHLKYSQNANLLCIPVKVKKLLCPELPELSFTAHLDIICDEGLLIDISISLCNSSLKVKV